MLQWHSGQVISGVMREAQIQYYRHKVPSTSRNGEVDCEEDGGYKQAEGEIDQRCWRPGGCQEMRNQN